MIRRNPTRIELKLDDLTEYNHIRFKFEDMKESRAAQRAQALNPPPKPKQEVVHERIGYDPQPRPSSSS